MKPKITVTKKIPGPGFNPEWVPEKLYPQDGKGHGEYCPLLSVTCLGAQDGKVTASDTMGDCESLAGTGQVPAHWEPPPHPIAPREVT